MLRWFAGLVLAALLVAGALFYIAGRGAPPSLAIDKPSRIVGQKNELQVTAGAPGGRLLNLTVTLEQNGRTIPLFSLDTPGAATVAQPDADHIRVTRAFGKQSVPELQQGNARIIVSAARKSLLNLRTLSSTASHDVQIRLEPPRIAVISTKHYVNHGGSEFVIYKATPPDVTSGVRVGDVEYPGFPVSGAAVAATDASVKGAFFALLHDQPLNTPIVAF